MMVKRKKRLCGLLIILLLTGGWLGVGEAAKSEPLYDKMKEVSQLINDEKWDSAAKEAAALKALYRKEKWKLQFLGDETEYQQIYLELEKLLAAVDEQDRTQAKIILSNIRAIVHNIYSM